MTDQCRYVYEKICVYVGMHSIISHEKIHKNLPTSGQEDLMLLFLKKVIIRRLHQQKKKTVEVVEEVLGSS